MPPAAKTASGVVGKVVKSSRARLEAQHGRQVGQARAAVALVFVKGMQGIRSQNLPFLNQFTWRLPQWQTSE
jgi:hypothetical protein